MCYSINIEGYILLSKSKQEANEEETKIFLNVKGAYICLDIQITEKHTFSVGVQNPLYSAWN